MTGPRRPEDYRLLAARLRALSTQAGVHRRAILITSPQPGDGKSTTVANVATALAQTGASVIAVDGNFLRPHLHTLFNISNERGLLELLHATDVPSVKSYVQPTTVPGLDVLPTGWLEQDAALLVASRHMGNVLNSLVQQWEYVLLDSPALLEAADASLLASSEMVDTFLVVDAMRTSKRTLQSAQGHLTQVHAHLNGALVNKATQYSDMVPLFKL